MLTQISQRRVIRQLCADQHVDVIHQPTPVSPRMPSLIFDTGAPVVIGPLNGGMDYPEAFRGHESGLSRILVTAGRGLSNLVNRLLPGKPRAAVILVANARTLEALPSGLRGKVVELVENAVDLETWMQPAPAPASETINQFIFIGRLVDWKRLDIALHALVSVPAATLVVVGDGPMRAVWEELTVQLGIAERVTFQGWLPQSQCALLLSQSIALLLPSVYECGGAVVLEAMASERPVIATRWGGPADYLDASSGFLVKPADENAMIEGFRRCMELLLADPALGRKMGQAGRQRIVEQFNWLHKIDRMEEIYQLAMTSTST